MEITKLIAQGGPDRTKRFPVAQGLPNRARVHSPCWTVVTGPDCPKPHSHKASCRTRGPDRTTGLVAQLNSIAQGHCWAELAVVSHKLNCCSTDWAFKPKPDRTICLDRTSQSDRTWCLGRTRLLIVYCCWAVYAIGSLRLFIVVCHDLRAWNVLAV